MIDRPEQPPAEPAKKAAVATAEENANELAILLANSPELADRLLRALRIGRFFATITWQEKKNPDDDHDLQHFWLNARISAPDVLLSIEHLRRDFASKQNSPGPRFKMVDGKPKGRTSMGPGTIEPTPMH